MKQRASHLHTSPAHRHGWSAIAAAVLLLPLAATLPACSGNDDATTDGGGDGGAGDGQTHDVTDTTGDGGHDTGGPDGGAHDGGAHDGTGDAAPDGHGAETGGCKKRWTVTESGTASVSVTAGGGILSVGASGASSGISVSITQGDLTGDFEAEARFANWYPGASGVYTQLAVRPVSDETQYAAARLITADPAGSQISAIVKTTSTSAPYRAAGKKDENMGRMWIKRTGGNISIEVATGPYPEKSPITKITNGKGFPSGPVTIGFEHGANKKLLGGGSIEYSAFQLTGGGITDGSDDFSCDSLK